MASKYPQHSAPSTKIHIQSQVKEYLVYDQIFFNKTIQFGVQKPRVTPGLEGYFYYTEHTGKYFTNYIKYFKTVKLNRDGRREES